MQVTKTKNRTERANILLYIIIIIGAVLIFTAPFWHIDLPKEHREITTLRKDLESKEKLLANEILDLRNSYTNGHITAEDYIIRSDAKNKALTELKESNFATVTKAIDERRILSWKSPRAFFLGFGIRLPYVLFSLIISLLILVRKDDSKHLNYAFSFLLVACWSISAYLMVWVFWDFQDYPLKTYRYAFILISILIGTACAFFISNYRMTFSILSSKIRYIMNLMIIKAVDKGHVKDLNKYEDDIIYPALKKLDE